MTLDENIIKKFEKNLKKKVNLSSYSWFNLGGDAEYFYKAKDKNELVEFLNYAKKENLKTTILGAGSNTLFRDNGVKGAVIKLGKGFSFIKLINEDVLEVGAATLDKKVANFSKENNLSNLEFLSCIPGSIGGAIVMNSGCYDNDISKILISIKAINKKDLKEIEIKKENIKFLYRGTNLPKDLIIISAKFKGMVGKKDDIEKKQSNFIEKKKLSQPSQIKTCGSTFKNLDKDRKAWMLIKEAGCQHFKEGDAAISQKHLNFFVNNGKAKSSDIESLINKVRVKVYEKTGVNLELEIKIIGE
ncbi:MAG: UDP-N-acetylmuramate dehydrogenase [Candidatus Pelagibacter bacterium]|nr:UDP-N-acetylmuramate dehydrogenase [Candidatus Pelagibacter bacterium]MBL6861047.1 UDP-N-acetylmuramate dehydrogenase [Candidatus Pelagibacter bacterium]